MVDGSIENKLMVHAGMLPRRQKVRPQADLWRRVLRELREPSFDEQTAAI